MPHLPHTDVDDLVASADEFSRALPALAGALGVTSAESSLERVREGLFYLAATAVDRIRDLEDDAHHALADAVAPDLLRPFPSATVVELSSERSVRTVPAGAEITTSATPPCRFRLVSEVKVGPWRVEGARVERGVGKRDALSFELVATGDPPLAECLGARVRIFVGGAREAALLLLAHLLAHTARAELAVEGGAPVPLGAVQPYGTRPEHALAPEPDGPYTGLALLREYFLAPDKFRFFELTGFAAALRGSRARRATVTLSFDAPVPADATLAPGGLRAQCVPAVNLFRSTAEPWVFEPGRTRAAVRVAGLRPDQGSVYAVVGASALARDDRKASPLPVAPVRRFGAGSIPQGFPYAFSTRRAPDPSGREGELVICLTSPRGRHPNLTPHVVSLELLATNGERASAVRPGELSEPGASLPPGVRARNIVASSPYVPAPTGQDLALQVAVRAQVPGPDPRLSLQSRLHSMVPRQGLAPAVARAHRARIAAITELQVSAVSDASLGRRGYEARLVIDETAFQGAGDVALFVRLLQAALEAQSSVSHFFRCQATCAKSGARITWPPSKP